MLNMLSRTLRILFTAFYLVIIANPAFAQERTYELNIPPQNLNAALISLAKVTNIQIMMDSDALQGKQTTGVAGVFSLHAALQKLLAGSGFTYAFTADDAVAIKMTSTQSNLGDAVRMPTVKVTADVVGYEDDPKGYNVTHTSVATKTDTPIMETPLNIQIVPQQVIRDQQAVRMEKALENVSAVNFVSQGAQGGASLNIRGFDTLSYYRDGSRVDTMIINTVFPDVSSLEQIQVLKGPASILYGRIEPGGFVNLVSKQPLSTPYNALQQQFGSFDYYRTTLDSTGPVNQDKSLLYRLNLAYENAGSFRDNFANDRVFLAPTLKWLISDNTQANFYLQYLHATDVSGGAIPAVGNRPADVPINLNLNENGSKFNTDDIRLAFDWSHAFNDHWTLKHYFSANLVNNPNASTPILGLQDPTNCSRQGCLVSRELWSAPTSQSQAYYTSINLTGDINTWGVAHTLLMGWDYLNEHSLQAGIASYNLSPIDLYQPIHTGTTGLLNNPDLSQSWEFGEQWHGFYMQDQLKLPYHFQLLAGFRYDMASQNNKVDTFIDTSTPSFIPTSSTDSETTHALKPRFGVLWQPIPEATLYANYVENFGLTNGHNVDGSLLPPTTAEQKEIGVKTELFDKRFSGTLAWFDLTKQNIATPSPNLALAQRGFSSSTGEVRNQGLELDLSGEPTPGLKLIGSYAYIDSRITKDVGTVYADDGVTVVGTNAGNQGNRYWGVPMHGGSFWTTYEPQDGELRGLKFGGGIVARGERQGDNANSYQLPGYVIFNFMAGYTWKVGVSKVSLQLNADNLLDKTYYNPYSSSGRYFVFANPRSFLGSIKVEF